MGSTRYAHCPRSTDVRVGSLELEIVVPHLDALIRAVTYIDVAGCIRRDRVRKVQLIRAAALCAGRLHEAAILVILRHAGVAIAIADEDIALSIERDICGPREFVWLIRVCRAAGV